MLTAIPLAVTALTGGFGQFAIGHSHFLPAFDLSPTEFEAHAPNAIAITIGPERAGFVVTSLSRFGKTVAIRPTAHAPTEIVYETTSLGFGLKYVAGMEWQGPGEAPFITWKDGTVGPGVPSAPAHWVVLTWPSERPPLLLVFSNPASLIAEKSATGFKLTAEKWTGRIHVRLPLGNRSVATGTAADFGGLLAEVTPLIDLLMQPAPKPLYAKVETVETGYRVIVKFDRQGAVVPPAALEAVANGRAIIESPVIEGGPKEMPLCSTDELVFTVLAPPAASPGTPFAFGSSSIEASSEEDLVLAYVTGALSAPGSFKLAALPPMVAMYTEPITGIGLPFASDGTGSYRTALRGAVFLAQGKNASFLDSLFAGIDWVTWQPPGSSPQEKANAAAAMAIAGPFCSSLENRAIAAMAGASRKLKTGFDPFLEGVYKSGARPDWAAMLYSPVKVLTAGTSVSTVAGGLRVSGVAETIESFNLTLSSDVPLQIASQQNVERTMTISTGARTTLRVRPKSSGEWSIIFRREAGASPIPKAVPSPRYSEALH
jgi:hypothetical protein